MDDAYNGLLEVISGTAKEAQKQAVYTGIIRSSAPLTIETGGVLLSREDLLLNEQLLWHSTAMDTGCRVVLVTADSDKFIVLCKVVSL